MSSKMPQKRPILHITNRVNTAIQRMWLTWFTNKTFPPPLPTSKFFFHHQRTDACFNFQTPFYLVGSAITKEAPTK